MAVVFTPESEDQLSRDVTWAAERRTGFDLRGGGSKAGLGRPGRAEHVLDLSAFRGIVAYEPEELVLTAKAATPLAEIVAALAENGQHLAFEPPTDGPLFAGEPGRATIGGTLACNLSGPRRVTAGAARDHFLGFRAVNGRGELIRGGGRVVKNVTGFDLCKLFAGSHGTLGAMTEVTLKVLPAPATERTVRVAAPGPRQAGRILRRALGLPHEVSAAACLPEDEGGVAVLRVEGPADSLDERARALADAVSAEGASDVLDEDASRALWARFRDAGFVGGEDTQVWRLSVPPSEGPDVAVRLADALEARTWLDWGGGQVWAEIAAADDARHEKVRDALPDAGGHATLVRADPQVRAAVPVFQPQSHPVPELASRIRAAFDPDNVFNPGRFG